MKRPLVALACLLIPVAAFSSHDPMERVANEFGRKICSTKNAPRVAILNFPYYNGKTSSGSSILAERLTTYIADLNGVRVIERALLKKIIEEQVLSETGILDATAAKKIGKVAGVDLIITGTLNDLESNKTEINARALRTDSGEVIAAARAVVERSWSDMPRSPQPTMFCPLPPREDDEKPAQNEAIEIGYPAGPWGPGRRR